MNTGLAAGELAIAHDYFTQTGGAERVVNFWRANLPHAELATALAREDILGPRTAEKITTSFLNRLPPSARDPRAFLPLLPLAIARMSLGRDIRAALISSSGWMHALPRDVPAVVYFHTPARWLYQPDDYRLHLSPLGRLALTTLRRPLETWDKGAISSSTSTHFLCNSEVSKSRLYKAYSIEAEVVYPPVVDFSGDAEEVPGLEPGYLLTVGRPRGYKNTYIVAEAARRLGRRLVAVGGLPQGDGEWPDSHVALSGITDRQLAWLYQNAEYLVSMSREDFGLTPIEANSAGTPVILLMAGGFTETTEEGATGVFAREESVESLIAAIREADRTHFNRTLVRANAERFSVDAHLEQITKALKVAATA